MCLICREGASHRPYSLIEREPSIVESEDGQCGRKQFVAFGDSTEQNPGITINV